MLFTRLCRLNILAYLGVTINAAQSSAILDALIEIKSPSLSVMAGEGFALALADSAPSVAAELLAASETLRDIHNLSPDWIDSAMIEAVRERIRKAAPPLGAPEPPEEISLFDLIALARERVLGRAVE